MSAGNRYLSVICLFLTFHFFKGIDSFFYASDLWVCCHGLPWFLGRRGRAAVPGVDAASEHGAPSVTRLCHRRGRRPSGWRPSPGSSQRVTVPLGTSETGPAHTVGEAGLRAPDGCTGPAVALRLSPGLARPEGAAAAVPMLGAHRDRLIVHPAARPRCAAGFQCLALMSPRDRCRACLWAALPASGQLQTGTLVPPLGWRQGGPQGQLCLL